jgi:hypothetical protein
MVPPDVDSTIAEDAPVVLTGRPALKIVPVAPFHWGTNRLVEEPGPMIPEVATVHVAPEHVKVMPAPAAMETAPAVPDPEPVPQPRNWALLTAGRLITPAEHDTLAPHSRIPSWELDPVGRATDITPALHNVPTPHSRAPNWELDPSGRSAGTMTRGDSTPAEPLGVARNWLDRSEAPEITTEPPSGAGVPLATSQDGTDTAIVELARFALGRPEIHELEMKPLTMDSTIALPTPPDWLT